jgi:hypothetical protein
VRLAAAHALLNLGVDPKADELILAAVINDSYIQSRAAALLEDIRVTYGLTFKVVAGGVVRGVPGGIGFGIPGGPRLPFPRKMLKHARRRTKRALFAAIDGPSDEFELPALPWPPPRFSSRDVLPRELLGTDDNNLEQIRAHLAAALDDAGFDEQALFGVEGGFALVTKVEQMHEDGTPYPSPERWICDPAPPFNLADYLGRLLLEKPGHFRLFIFIVTTLGDFTRGGEGFSEGEARAAILEGGRVLPSSIGNSEFRDHNCHVLVYHFEKKKAGTATLHAPSELSTRVHLETAGIWSRLDR